MDDDEDDDEDDDDDDEDVKEEVKSEQSFDPGEASADHPIPENSFVSMVSKYLSGQVAEGKGGMSQSEVDKLPKVSNADVKKAKEDNAARKKAQMDRAGISQ